MLGYNPCPSAKNSSIPFHVTIRIFELKFQLGALLYARDINQRELFYGVPEN